MSNYCSVPTDYYHYPQCSCWQNSVYFGSRWPAQLTGSVVERTRHSDSESSFRVLLCRRSWHCWQSAEVAIVIAGWASCSYATPAAPAMAMPCALKSWPSSWDWACSSPCGRHNRCVVGQRTGSCRPGSTGRTRRQLTCSRAASSKDQSAWPDRLSKLAYASLIAGLACPP